MKKRMGLILLAAALALSSGCAAMLERSYVSATTHVDYDSEEEDPSILRAETYQSLVNSILYFVESHAATGTIRLYNYTGDVEADLANACTEILNEDPLGAYAVRDIRYDTTRIVTYYEVNLSLIYSRSSQEVEAIRSVSGLSELRQAFSDLVSDGGTHAAFRFSYFSWTEQYLEELFWLECYSDPLHAVPGVQVAFSLYPDSGSQRIVELTVTWPRSGWDLSQRAALLAQSTDALLEEHPPEGDSYTPEELIRTLRGLGGYDEAGSQDPAEVLAGQAADDMGLLLTAELLFQRAGLEASMVLGSLGQEPYCWLIVETEEGYRHLLSQDIGAGAGSGEGSLPLYTDDELESLGYSWPAGLHQACE